MCFYLRNWQVTFLLYTLGVKITEYIAKAPIEPRDYRMVFLIPKRRMDRIHTPNLHIVIILSESFQQCFPDSSFQTDTLVSHTQSQPKSES